MANFGIQSAGYISGSTQLGNGTVTEVKLGLSDNATANASTTAHGFLKKLSNVATEFMNGAGNWVSISSKQNKQAVTTWNTSFSTASSSYVDVTDASVTVSSLDSSKTYNLVAMSSLGSILTGGAGFNAKVSMNIDGTNCGEVGETVGSSYITCGVSGMKANVTGATSYIAKIQAKSASGTLTVNPVPDTASIVIMAFEV